MPTDPLHPGTIGVTVVLGLCVFFLPRRWVALPILVAAIFIPDAPRIVIATLDFNMIRLLLLCSFLRLFLRGEVASIKFNSLDGVMIALFATLLVAGTLREGSPGVVVNRLGRGFDSFGLYFYMRLSLRSWTDLRTTLLGALACLGIFATLMSIEWTTGRNLFSVLGGVPERTLVRDGALRCQGAFSHPIMAGVFGASWAPMIASLWWDRQRFLAGLGVACCILIAFFSSSSTPLLGLALGFLGLGLWPARRHMRLLRWSLLAALIVIHFVREQPVWHLLSRVRVIGSSSGWHRFVIIDRAIAHLGEWWLIGNRDIRHWGIYANDITNYYVATGLDGGLLATLLFVALFVAGFRLIGRVLWSRGVNMPQRRFVWSLGSTLFAHCAIFLAAKYFGQMNYVWYLHLAMVGALPNIVSSTGIGARTRTTPDTLGRSESSELVGQRPSSRTSRTPPLPTQTRQGRE